MGKVRRSEKGTLGMVRMGIWTKERLDTFFSRLPSCEREREGRDNVLPQFLYEEVPAT